MLNQPEEGRHGARPDCEDRGRHEERRHGGRPSWGVSRIGRRRVLQGAALLFGSGLLVSFRSLAGRVTGTGGRQRHVVIQPPIAQDIVFTEGVIVCRTSAGFGAFSARCPHLGCEITRAADGLIVCPCHGSRFRTDGTVAVGPASKRLQPLPCSVDSTTGVVTVLAGGAGADS